MTKKQWSVEYQVFDNENSLDAPLYKLWKTAQNASKKAYAPYSNFCVGAALLLKNGEIIEGANQENAAYPSGLCAERVAFFSAGVLYPNETIEIVAVTAKRLHETETISATPCGACRQVMSEFENKQAQNIRLLCMGQDQKIYLVNSMSDLLPFQFNAKNLK